MGVKAFIPERAVERLDKRVVSRTARTREVKGDPLPVSPLVEDPAGEFTTIIGLYPLRISIEGSELSQDGHDLIPFYALVSVDS